MTEYTGWKPKNRLLWINKVKHHTHKLIFYVTYFPKYCINSMNMWKSYLCVCGGGVHMHNYVCIMLSYVWLFAIPWTIACQAPLSVGFSKQEYWSWLSFPTPGNLLNPWVEPTSLALPILAGAFFTTCHLGSPITCWNPYSVCSKFRVINRC